MFSQDIKRFYWYLDLRKRNGIFSVSNLHTHHPGLVSYQFSICKANGAQFIATNLALIPLPAACIVKIPTDAKGKNPFEVGP